MNEFERKEWEMKKALLGTYNGSLDNSGEPPRKVVDDNGKRVRYRQLIWVRCTRCQGSLDHPWHKLIEYFDRGKINVSQNNIENIIKDLSTYRIIANYCDVCGPRPDPKVKFEKWR